MTLVKKEIKDIHIYKEPITAGVYHNSGLGLISYSGDGTTRYTIADKNLGATQVWNEGDTLNAANCGNYFQRGNNYPFDFSAAPSSTSSSTVDASTYGPGNYYSSSTFITGNKNRDSSTNHNLWGDTTDTLVARRGPCAEGYHVPTLGEMNTVISIAQSFGLGIWQDVKTYWKWPYAGDRGYSGGSGSPSSLGSYGHYWLSSTSNGYRYAYGSYLGDDYSNNGTWVTTYTKPIRPFKNVPVIPDSSWTKLL